MLLAHYSIVSNKKFLEDERGKYISFKSIKNYIEDAVVFYYLKKDKEIENRVKRELLKINDKSKIEEEISKIKRVVFEKYPILDGLEIDEKIYLPEEGIENSLIKVFDSDEKEFIKSFKSEIFKGTIEDFKIKSPNLDKIKTALLSFSRALAQKEHMRLKDTILEDNIIEIQNQIANEWEFSLKIGKSPKDSFHNSLLFFWKIKEVREKILKELNIDIFPKEFYYIPKYKELSSWCEYRVD